MLDQDGDGYISKGDLREVVLRLGSNLTNQDMEEMFTEADKDGDGHIDYEGEKIPLFHAYMYACLSVFMYVYMYACMRGCVNDMHIVCNVCISMYVCICMYVCMYVCMYLCVYVGPLCMHAYQSLYK